MKIDIIDSKFCPNCKNPFKCSDDRVVYCSTKCDIDARRKYMRERMQKLRAQRWTEEMSEKMGWLKDNQQVSDNIILDKCWVCGSTENLIVHHVKYYPECIIKILCQSCSTFLHKSLLRGKRCKYRIIKNC